MDLTAIETAPSKADVERQGQALALRAAGAPYAAIAKTLGYADIEAAVVDVEKALEVIRAPTTGDMVKLELDRLDRMQVGIWNQATHGNPEAIKVVIRIMERRAKLLGLDKEDRRRPSILPLPDSLWKVLDAEVAAEDGDDDSLVPMLPEP